MDLFIYRRGEGFIGEISDYESLEIERNYYTYSKLTLRLPKNQENINLLKLGNMITTDKDKLYPYQIEHFSVIKEGKRDIIEVYGVSLNYILSNRTIIRQEVYSGNVEDVVKRFITSNAINSLDASRNIPGLILGANTGIAGTIQASRTGGDLMTNSFDLLKEVEATIDIVLSPNLQNFEVVTWKAPDRSILQNVNNHVIFSSEYDNVLNQSYYIDTLKYKNTTVVAGEGEGVLRTVATVGSASGWDRREIYVDARDLQSTYQDENGTQQTLTPTEYEALLINRGIENNNNSDVVESFEATIDRVQYIVGRDYNIGDKITFFDNEINIVKNVRTVQITTTVDPTGVTDTPSFGTTKI